MKRKLAVSAIGAVLVAGALLAAAFATPDKEAKSLGADSIDSYVARLQVGPPQRHANLTLYPVLADGVVVPDVDLTLDKAMERGFIEIRELKPADVNRSRSAAWIGALASPTA